jgi:hypothetical protein
VRNGGIGDSSSFYTSSSGQTFYPNNPIPFQVGSGAPNSGGGGGACATIPSVMKPTGGNGGSGVVIIMIES